MVTALRHRHAKLARANVMDEEDRYRGAKIMNVKLLIERIAYLCMIAVAAVSVTAAAAREPGTGAPLGSEEKREAQQLLSDLGYLTGPVNGALDERFRQALIAFQKVDGLKLTGRLTAESLQALRHASRPLPLEGGYPHIEVDIDRQVLFIIDRSGIVSRIIPVSTGSGKLFTEEGRTHRAYTPRGRFTVYRKIAGWRKAPLGLIYQPNYIFEGIAIHGSQSVPPYPASHGCVRIPMFAASEVGRLTPIGTVVIIYDKGTR